MSTKINTNVNEEDKKTKYGELLFEMIKDYPVKRTPAGMLVQVEQNGIKKNMLIQGDEFSSYVQKRFKDIYGVFASAYAMKSCITYKKAQAYEKEVTNTEMRVAMTEDDSILYDLCNGYFVKITNDGWEVIENDEKTFLEVSSEHKQITPIKSENGWERLWKYLNLSESEKLLYTVYVVSCLFPKLTVPSITINGPRRSGKSTLSDILKRIIDPIKENKEIFPDSLDDLKVTLNKSYYVVFDNMSTLTKKQSDFLCSVVTGTSVVSRKKYQDSEAFIINLKKGLCMNGITQYVKRSDLAERMLFFSTQTIPNNVARENRLWEDFDEELPYILGGVFDLLSMGLRDYRECQRKSPIRWGDFYRFAYCVAENMNHRGTEFEEVLLEIQGSEFDDVYEDNPLINLITEFIEDCQGEWESTPERLHKYLLDYMKSDEKYKYYADIFPKKENQMSRKLFEQQTTLLSKGIKLERIKNNKGRFIKISRVNDKKEESTVVQNNSRDGIVRVPIIIGRQPIILNKTVAETVSSCVEA